MPTQTNDGSLSHPKKRPEEMEEEIRQARTAISADLKELGQKLSPENLKQGAREILRDAKEEATDMLREAKDHALESVSETVNEIGEKARRMGARTTDFVSTNAIPLTLIGLGAGWLMMSLRSQRRYSEGGFSGEEDRAYGRSHSYYGRGRAYGRDMSMYQGAESEDDELLGPSAETPYFGKRQGASSSEASGTEELLERGKEQVAAAKRRVQGVAQDLGHRAQDVAHTARERASDLGHRAREQLQRAEDYTRDFSRENPMALFALAVLSGVGLGLMLPSTQPENRLMGKTRERLLDTANETAREVGRTAREGAAEVKKTFSEPSAPH